MSDLEEQGAEFSRLLERGEVNDAPRAVHRDALREQALAGFDAASPIGASNRWQHAFDQGREIMQRPVVRYSALAAACLVVAAIWLFAPGGPSTAEAFHKFAEAIVDAKSAKFQMEVHIEGQPEQKAQAYYLAPGKFRQELAGDLVNISDWSAGKMVGLNPKMKMATVMNIKHAPKDAESTDLFQQMRELLADRLKNEDAEYERLGEKQIDGRKAIGFRLDSPLATTTLWGDPETGLPVRIEGVYSGVPRTETIMSNFELNVELDAELFDVNPPQDYQVKSFDIDATPFTEADFIAALRTTSDLADGRFPDALDTATIMKEMIGYLERQRKQDDPKSPVQLTEKMMQTSMTIGRGFGFALSLPESADAHYAGRGVERGTADRPIFWYMPESKAEYRVIFADLSVHEAPAAPEVPGAVKIEKAGSRQPAAE